MVGDDRGIRGVLFDVGGVLIRPIGGRWNPRYDFEGLVVAHYPGIRLELFPEAFAVGRRVLDAGSTTANRTDYHRANWAGLEVDFRSLGIERYFAGFAISEVLGCRKPDPRMYAAGSEFLGLEPGRCLFVDDDPQLVSAAIQLGYHGVALIRDGQPVSSVPMITTLDELPPIIAGAG